MSEKKKGFLGGLFGGKRTGSCCDMEIIEETESDGACCPCCSPKASTEQAAKSDSRAIGEKEDPEAENQKP